MKGRYSEPILNPQYDFSKPTEILNDLRSNDRNALMFGRSKNPTDAMTENSGKNELLKGYANSSEMGNQYGTFTGMTLYSGPEMFDRDVIDRVFD